MHFKAKLIRKSCLKMVHEANASHLASALSIVDILNALYSDFLKTDPHNQDWEDRDRLLLSKGHACVALYSTLAEYGFFPKEDLINYGKDFSDLMNHVSHKVSGVEFSTGSLGHALPFGVGKAMAAKRLNKKWKTVVILSDGELGEGSNWEAFLSASHHKLDNLVAIVDYNKLQSLTTVEDTLNLEPLIDKFKAFGWAVLEVDGHDHNMLVETFKKVPFEMDKPSVFLANTVKGKGVSFMENSVQWHYKSPSDQELALAIKEIKNA